MALGSCAGLKCTSELDQLLEEINFQRTKEMRQMMKDNECGFVVLQGTTYWTDLFVRHFLFQEEHSIDCDDLLFFVRKRHVKTSSRHMPKYETAVEVFRKDSKKLPIGDPEVEWEETVYLNLVVHRFEYTLTVAVCTRTSPKQLQVLRRRAHPVYASPSKRRMDTKGEGEEMTYPHVCFMVDNFDEVFSDIVVRDGEMVCVELVARGRGASSRAVLFLGSIRYDALASVHDTRQSSLSSRVAARVWGVRGSPRVELIRLRGPGGRGYAEVGVARPSTVVTSGANTPASEPALSPTDDWPDLPHTPNDLCQYKHQRRLSDPSANVNDFVRWRTREGKCRSEDEGLDSMADGMAEIEAGDLRDGNPASSRSHFAKEIEMAQDALDQSQGSIPPSALDHRQRMVKGKEELPCDVPETRKSSVLYENEIPPRRRTSDGTDIYFWSDLKKNNELDDGLLHPIWSSRGFAQSFHSWKEGRRIKSLPLCAYLTYVTLPWWSIAKDILEHREEPILTF